MKEGAKVFGELIYDLRKEKGWTVKDLLDKIEYKTEKRVSPAYITRIEVHNEIPSPEFIYDLSETFGVGLGSLMDVAKRNKVEQFRNTLDDKFDKAVGLYRKRKTS